MEVALRRLNRSSAAISMVDDDPESNWQMLVVLKGCALINCTQQQRLQATLTRRADITPDALSELRHVAVSVYERAKLLEASKEQEAVAC